MLAVKPHSASKSLHGKAEEPHAVGEVATVHAYPIITTDFSRVEMPFIIGVWILFASIAKIGE